MGNLPDAVGAIERLDRAAAALRSSPFRRGSAVCLESAGRLLVTGDLHDNPAHLRAIVALARLGDSPAHHLVLHEIVHGDRLVNGLDLSHRMLVRVAELVAAHPAQVHVLLANHELAQMTGKGVSKGGGDSVALFEEGLRFAFGDRGPDVSAAAGRMVRAMPLVLRSEGGLLCAHSLPGSLAGFDPGVLERPMQERDYQGPGGAAYRMVWGRGWDERLVEALAERWGVRLFCVGHQHIASGIEVRGTRVVILNSDHEQAAVLPLDLARLPSAGEAVLQAVKLRGLEMG